MPPKHIQQEYIYMLLVYKRASPVLTPLLAAAQKNADQQVRIGDLSHFRGLRAVHRELRGAAAGA